MGACNEPGNQWSLLLLMHGLCFRNRDLCIGYQWSSLIACFECWRWSSEIQFVGIGLVGKWRKLEQLENNLGRCQVQPPPAAAAARYTD